LPILLFFAILLGSIPLALLYSGSEVATGSLMRALLFGISVYVFLYALAGPRRPGTDSFTSLRLLFSFAVAAALFACIDFYFHLPAPAGFGEQFIWLDSGVFRRAQGLFYEASTLGNFSAFFLIMILVAGFGAPKDRPFPRPVLAVGFMLFSGSLVFSYSRASAINVLVAICALLYARRVPVLKLVLTCALFATAAAVILSFALPDFFSHYLTRAMISFEYFGQAPNRILSGRITTWQTILSLIAARPWDVILGIGYKTLPYSRYAGEGIIADNTYLSLLLETGLVGLGAFLLMNAAILRAALKAARCGLSRASFFGTWIFCFWCGELVQMVSGDLITYWRVLPLYFWVLATAVRESSTLGDAA
jgi:O-antigen ligase